LPEGQLTAYHDALYGQAEVDYVVKELVSRFREVLREAANLVRSMTSLRTRLLALWLMLAASAIVTSVLLWQFYQQTSNAQISRAEDDVARACRDITERYTFFVAGWHGVGASGIDETLRGELSTVVQMALARAPGVEGGIWQGELGSLAYAFPTYEGTGPKTDLPAAELSTIRQVNEDALRNERPVTVRQSGRSQVLIVHSCPLPGPLAAVSGWTMTRAFTGQGGPYNRLLIGLAVLGLTVLGSAIWLGRILVSWSRKLARLETALAGRDGNTADLPALPATGERELDRLVDALNATGLRLGDARRRAASAERLAAVGRVAAGVAHEIRNPIAAMRLKAENALAVDDPGRRISALQSILEQIGRLDGLLRDLLNMTQRRKPQPAPVNVRNLLEGEVETHRELAIAKGVALNTGAIADDAVAPRFDVGQIRQALDNLILNAIQNTPAGGSVTLAANRQGHKLRLDVIDTGPGIPEDIRERLFEPFVTGRADGTGLGLAIVRETARAHGGDACLVSCQGGAVFRIELPWQSS
jgi:signal transduction histidine kinase